MASRILGMGDVLTLIERAQETIDDSEALELERKLKTSEFGLDDLLDQLRRIRKMGSLRSLLGMIPGIGKQVKDLQVDDKQLDRVEAMILSMTPSERRNPSLIDGSRRRRIASGSGTSVQQINQLLQQHRQMKKMMKQVASGGAPALGGAAGMQSPQKPRPAGSRNARKKKRRR
jgi:signal recognition particle subunit SRP54